MSPPRPKRVVYDRTGAVVGPFRLWWRRNMPRTLGEWIIGIALVLTVAVIVVILLLAIYLFILLLLAGIQFFHAYLTR